MTNITFFKRNGRLNGFCAQGHSGYADAGQDIVCSAISMLTTNTVNSLTELNHEEIDLSVKDGMMEMHLLTNKEASSEVLLRSLELGIASIQDEYGSKFVKVDYKEENANVKA